jgi:hypothetical protein
LSEWEAYDRLDPIGTWRDDFRMAFLATLMTNLGIRIHGKKGSKLVELSEFMPIWDQAVANQPKPQSVEDMKSVLLAIANTQKKKEVERKPPVKRTNMKKQ